MLKVRTLFSGVGSPEMALTALGIDFELVDFCEVDKYAVKSYCAIHNVPKEKNLGDITKVNGKELPYADMMVWGFPCTDISVAGKQEGLIKGVTRSGLYYEGLGILHDTKPKYSVIENVKNLTGKKFKPVFESILADLKAEGYNNYWQVLNAKNYGIPQNRERVFIVSIRKDVDDYSFKFPEPVELKLRLKDLLEQEVDEKFYINKPFTGHFPEHDVAYCLDANYWKGSTTEGFLKKHRRELVADEVVIEQVGMLDIRGNEQVRRVYSADGISPTLNTMQGGNRQPKIVEDVYSVPLKFLGRNQKNYPSDYAMCVDTTQTNGVAVREATKQGFAVAEVGDSINMCQPNSKTRRGRVGHGVAQTLDTSCNQATVLGDYRVRRLTPRECWRLMGFSDADFNKAQAVNSNTQLYKQAGNSIVKQVLMAIFNNLI